MIPGKIAVTFCRECESKLVYEHRANGALCTQGCQWDESSSRERPVVVRTYWLREELPIEVEEDGV